MPVLKLYPPVVSETSHLIPPFCVCINTSHFIPPFCVLINTSHLINYITFIPPCSFSPYPSLFWVPTLYPCIWLFTLRHTDLEPIRPMHAYGCSPLKTKLTHLAILYLFYVTHLTVLLIRNQSSILRLQDLSVYFN